ncbi:MAG: hypothetical protein RIC14_05285 [Filomicrobium sp.]
MPGALLTGLVLSVVVAQFFAFARGVQHAATPLEWAPECYRVPQKLSVSPNTPDYYRARQKRKMERRIAKQLDELMELGTLCQAGKCSSADRKRFHKVFTSYMRNRSLNYKYAHQFTGPLGPAAFRRMYETRREALMREIAVKLHETNVLDLRYLSGYSEPARIFLYKRPSEFVACS